jgi:hypothetical protein
VEVERERVKHERLRMVRLISDLLASVPNLTSSVCDSQLALEEEFVKSISPEDLKARSQSILCHIAAFASSANAV